MGYEVTGVNISPSMLEKAREKDRKAKVKFVEGDMKRPDKSVPRNKKFDAAICLGIASSHLLTNKDVRAFLRGLQDSQKGRSASFRRQKREENQRRVLEQVARGTHDN
jgi:SAM-dependent methyltransferase